MTSMLERATRELATPATASIALGTLAALAGLVVYNGYEARRAERDNPPVGAFVDVDGVLLHYLDEGKGNGPPIVLLHGNLVTLDDWVASGVFDLLAERHRVIAFDRPGFGYSERPRDRYWGALEQAKLLRRACRMLGASDPIVVGHSWGTLPALGWALDAPRSLGGLMLIGGYYFPTTRFDAALVAPAATPVVGALLRHTLSPPTTRAGLPAALKGMFAPRPIPDRFRDMVPIELISRPSQIRAIAREGAYMVGEVKRLSRHGGMVACPTAIMAGADDGVVDPHDQSERLARQLRAAELAIVPGAGHMVHHAVPERVAETVDTLARAARGPEPSHAAR